MEILRHNFLAGLRETTKYRSEDSKCLSQDSNLSSSECKSTLLPLEQLDGLPVINGVIIFNLMELLPQASRRWSYASTQHWTTCRTCTVAWP
jgi:hypothetical protein